MSGLSKRKTHRLLPQCQSLELTQTFPTIRYSQGEEIARRIQKKQVSEASTQHPCLEKFYDYRRCVAQYHASYLTKCSVVASRYRECLKTASDWKPIEGTNYVEVLHSLGIFSNKKKPTIEERGAGSVMQFRTTK